MHRGDGEYINDHLYLAIYYDRDNSSYHYGILLAAQDREYGSITHTPNLDYTWLLNRNPNANRWTLQSIRAQQCAIRTLVARILLRKFSPTNRVHLEPALDKYLKMVPITQDDPQFDSASWTYAAICLLVENKVIKIYIPLQSLIKEVSEFARRVNKYYTGPRLSRPLTAFDHYITPTDDFMFITDF